jgi:hypothetical protein
MRDTLVYRNRLTRFLLVDQNRSTRFLMALAGALFLGVVAYSAEPSFTAAQREWWSLKPVVKPAVPEVKNRQWVKTPVDAFVLAALEAKGLTPNPAADRVTLLRRASIDITGLPPTKKRSRSSSTTRRRRLGEGRRSAPGVAAVRRALGTALARRRSATRQRTASRPTRRGQNIWRYRDYVIKAFNDDKPYDRLFANRLPATSSIRRP